LAERGARVPTDVHPRKQRRLAVAVLGVAAVLAIAAFPVRGTWWGAWILAIAEAGIVGGLADWFAVTAIFRHPLGIPIPHTALIPANWQLMAARVGGMVGGRILTTEYVTREIARVDVAGLLAQLAERVKPADVEPILRAVARWVATQLPPESATELVSWLRRLFLSRPVSPLIAEVLEVIHRIGWDQRVIEALARTLVETLDRPDVRRAVGDLVDEVLESYRRNMGVYPGMLLRFASIFGLIDRDRIVSALRAALGKVAEDPDDPLRRRLSAVVAELPDRLRSDPDLAARIESTKTELLESPALTGLFEDAAAALHRALVAGLSGDRAELVAWLSGQLEGARQTLVADKALRESLDRWLKQHAATIVARYQNHLASFIERGVHALGAEGAVRLIEEHAGDDLQYIRVNGTVVGGLAGGAIYGVHLLIDLL
jgi:uncharacterized membrane-anchored protein YjiN (DUF445 family)